MRRIATLAARFSKRREYQNPTKNIICSEFEVDNWIISEFIINEIVPIIGVRPYPLNELLLMVAAVTHSKPTHIFEWGTHLGKSARLFYETVRHFNIDTTIHSIDLPMDEGHIEHPGEDKGVFLKEIEDVKLWDGDGISISLEIYRTLEHVRAPLFFLDGDHSYDTVKRKLAAIITNVTDPVILVHDTFYQSSESGYNVGPYQAIAEKLGKSKGSEFKIISTQTGLPGMTLLYRKG